MIIHNVRQGDEQWDELRRGIPTSSQFCRIGYNRKKDGLGVGAMSYLCELVAQCFDVWVPSPPNFWMERGTEMEPEAVRAYELLGYETTVVGFVTSGDLRYGCSPDRICNHGTGLLETKCPAAQTHIRYLLDGGLPKEYEDQVRGQMMVCNCGYVDFFSYCPGLRPLLVRVNNDETQKKWEAKFVPLLELFLTELENAKAIVKG